MKTVLITGGSGGVATALAQKLHSDGWRVVLASRDPEKISFGRQEAAIAADVSTLSGAQEAVAMASQTFGAPPAAMVNSAGAILIAAIGRTSEAQYRDCLSANLDTAFFMSRAYTDALQKAKQPGAILLFSSVAAALGVSNHAAIAMAKGGIEALVRSLAADFSSSNIRINAIAPGLMKTPATERMVSSEASAKAISAQYPLGRYGQAEDAANLAAFLLSEHASWISGQIIALDGGFTAVRPYVRG